MVENETRQLMDAVEVLVSDKLQVVSYKWLSRNYSISSNDAKRFLQEFAEKHSNGLEIIYSLSGWLKDSPGVYHVRLVSGNHLSEAQQAFEGSFSVQVYSVQSCIPKDPAVLWSTEFVQAEELFNQPSNINNCLRDNRFCGVSNSFVKRNFDGVSTDLIIPPPKSAIGSFIKADQAQKVSPILPQKASPIPLQQASPVLPQPGQENIPGLKNGFQSSTVGLDKGNVRDVPEAHAQTSKSTIKHPAVDSNENKEKKEKNSSGNGGSLSSLWGRVSSKSKIICPPATTNNNPNSTCGLEAPILNELAHNVHMGDEDDDNHEIDCKRDSIGGTNRKRKVFFDFSDEDDFENVVSLSSPDPPKMYPLTESELQSERLTLEKQNLNFEVSREIKRENSQENTDASKCVHPMKTEYAVACKNESAEYSFSEQCKNDVTSGKDVTNKSGLYVPPPSLPKRKKVLKTRIDEKGREVTDVIWEGEILENNKDTNSTTTGSVDNRPSPCSRSSALLNTAAGQPTSRGGNKKTVKGGPKDAKQGNILSFFKKV